MSLILRPWFQISLMAVTIIFILFTANIKLAKTNYYDFKPSLINVDSKNFSEIDFQFDLQNFIKADFLLNEFILDAILWFVFDPKKVTIEDISKFSFSKSEIIYKSEPVIQKFKDKLIARFDLRLKSMANLNFKYFPLDTHRLFITLDNKFLDSDFRFSQKSKLNVSESIYVPAWKFLGSQLELGFKKIKTVFSYINNPRAILQLDFIQENMRSFIFLFLPMLIILLISLCAFALNLKNHFETVLSLTSAGVIGLVGYRYVIEKISPKVSYYMLSDHIFNLILIILFVIFFADIFYKEKLDRYRGLMVLSLYMFFILAWSYLMFLW